MNMQTPAQKVHIAVRGLSLCWVWEDRPGVGCHCFPSEGNTGSKFYRFLVLAHAQTHTYCDPASKRSKTVLPYSIFSSPAPFCFFKEWIGSKERRGMENRWTPCCSLCRQGWRNKQLALLTGGGEGKESQSGRAGFSWLLQPPPGVICWATSRPPLLYLKYTIHSPAVLCLPS